MNNNYKNEYIEELIYDKNYIYYAHTGNGSNDKELLSSHLLLTLEYYEKMAKYKNLEEKIKNIIKVCFDVNESVCNRIYDLFKSAVFYHDIGKINPMFQKLKMNNDLDIECDNLDSTHAGLSARIFIDYTIKKIKNEEWNQRDKLILVYVTYYFGYIISRHHTSLETLMDLEKTIKNQNIPQFVSNTNEFNSNILHKLNSFLDKTNPDSVALYILCKTLHSCIITADFYATYEYMTGKKAEVDSKKDNELFDKYKKSDLIEGIRKYQNGEIELSMINKLRCDMFIESENKLRENLNANIYYLEAPTGSGKTNMAINLAKVLYENCDDIKSVEYIFPFNNIIEQTSQTFKNYFEEYKQYVVVNSITSIIKDEKENLDYELVYMKNIFRQFPIIITSHINLFDTLFGIGKEANYGIYHYIDSIVVIDEIQSYSNSIWKEIIEMFSKYAKLLNIKFIIMSATLPRMDKLLDENFVDFCTLIDNTEKYYQNDVFKNRVKLKFDLLDKKISMEELVEKILEYKDKKVLIEMIKKSSAEKLYNILKQQVDNVYELTGDDNKYSRLKIIEKSKEDNPIIIVATQTIEAGVDIDMDIGFKDISFIDSEEQFIGRINRSNKKVNSQVFFFDYDDARTVYKKDNRLQFNLKKIESQEWLVNKNFSAFYINVIDKIYKNKNSYTNENIDNFYHYCSVLNFRKIEDVLRLIKNESIQIFLNYELQIGNQIIRGNDVFEQLKQIYKDDGLSYSEKKVKLSMLSDKVSLFTYNIPYGKIDMIKGEKFGDMYYVDDGYRYIVDGRFNRSLFLGESEDLFI